MYIREKFNEREIQNISSEFIFIGGCVSLKFFAKYFK